MPTADEENALSAFLRALALALDGLFDQVEPQDRTMKNFQRGLDGYLREILTHPTIDSQAAQEGARLLKRLLYREIERMPLHRLKGDVKH